MLPDFLIFLAIMATLGSALALGDVVLRLLDRRQRLARWIERLSDQ